MPHIKKQLTIFCTLLISTASLSAEGTFTIPQHEKLFHNLKGEFYGVNCELISLFHTMRSALLTTYYLTRHDLSNPEKHILAIDNIFKSIKNELIEREQRTLDALQKEFAIGNASWKQCIRTINALKTCNKKALCSAQPETDHNASVPEDLLTILTDILKKNGIHPDSISIGMTDEKSEQTLAQASGFIAYRDMYIQKNFLPQKIDFSPLLLEKCNSDKIAVCAHEVEHLLQQHVITNLVIEFYIKQHGNISEETIANNAAYKYLCKIHEEQAEIFPALRNPEIAPNMLLFRATSYYPDYLYEDHFYMLSLICKLWEVRNRLTWANPYLGAVKSKCKWFKQHLTAYLQ